MSKLRSKTKGSLLRSKFSLLKPLAKKKKRIEAIVIGTSAGGIQTLQKIFLQLPEDFPVPIIVVQHLGASHSEFLIEVFQSRTKLRVKQADEKEKIKPGTIYFAPPDYHLMIEKNKTFSLSDEEKHNYARPSIDVLFETAADSFASSLVGVILTGANSDGAQGLKVIREKGGITIVQDPKSAEVATMPLAAMAAEPADYVVPANALAALLTKIAQS